MTIIVETSGPLDTLSSIITPAASTFGDLISQIADEVDDTTGEYRGQIQNAILQAIRFCERDVYYFNETRDVTFPTVQDRQWYDSADNAQIPRLVSIVDAYCERADGRRFRLRRAEPQEIELLADNSASTGEPYCYTYFGQRVRLYPIPGAEAYTIRLQLGPYRLATIANEADGNVWTTEAFDMIKARAKYVLYKDILKDATMAAEALNDYNDQHKELKAETSRRNASGVIKVTCF